MITSAEEQTARVKSFIVSLAFQTKTTMHKIGTQNSSLNGKILIMLLTLSSFP